MVKSIFPVPLSLATLDQHMVTIAGGSFDMGSNEYGDEKPIHRVTLDSFALCRYPVTQALWREVMGADPEELYFSGNDRPVEMVSRNDCQLFLEKLNQLAGLKGYRLPTEAEWAFAARGGESYYQDFQYAGSSDLDEVGWCYENSFGETPVIGLKLPNAFGLYDLSGNVWEHCDSYNNKYYDNSTGNSPQAQYRNDGTMVSGGSWRNDEAYAHISESEGWSPGSLYNDLGFRLARSL